MPGPSACLLPLVADQVNQHRHEDGEHHGDSEEIAEDFNADLAPGHSWSVTHQNRAAHRRRVSRKPRKKSLGFVTNITDFFETIVVESNWIAKRRVAAPSN
jgi:hypothetical protein